MRPPQSAREEAWECCLPRGADSRRPGHGTHRSRSHLTRSLSPASHVFSCAGGSPAAGRGALQGSVTAGYRVRRANFGQVYLFLWTPVCERHLVLGALEHLSPRSGRTDTMTSAQSGARASHNDPPPSHALD